jgi:two-component system cell cycle sensor histidine kinase/response regulator CckA
MGNALGMPATSETQDEPKSKTLTSSACQASSDSILRLLFAEDGPAAEACVRELELAEVAAAVRVVRTREEMEAAARECGWDVAVVDWALPGWGPECPAWMREAAPGCRLIALLEPGNEQAAVDCLEAGAYDYVFKDRLVRLRRIAANVIEQKRLVGALRGSEERWRMLVQRSLAGVCRSTLDGRFLDVNQAAADMLGFPSPHELVALRMTDVFWDPEERAALVAALRRYGALTNWELKLKRRDGSPVWALANIGLAEDGQVIEGTLMDITARKLAEEKSLRLNRLYSVLSHVSQAVARIGDWRELMQEVCRIAVADGGFLLAWFGEANESAGVFEPVARHGAAANADACRPAIHVLREHRRLVLNDVGDGGLPPSWQRRAIESGCRSMAAFTIRVRERLAGALVFCGAERNIFDAENLQLLDEVAGTVSFALESMERERDRQLAEEERMRLYASEQAARAEARADSRYRELLEAAPDGIMEVDREGRILMANPAAQRIFGYAAEELLGRELELLLPERYREQHSAWRSEFMADPARPRMRAGGEVRARRKNGAEFPAEVSLSPVSSDESGMVICIVRDVTKRKLAEGALRESNHRIVSILESITDAFIAVDNGWKLTYLNGKAEQIMRCRREEAIGKNIWEQFPELSGSVLEQECRRAAATHTPVEFTTFYPMPQLWAEIHVYPGENGLSIYSQDITARKHLEDQFLQAQKLEALGRLAGGVAHDFNNLLTIIGGYGQMLMDSLDPRSPVRKDVEPIVEAAARASALTRQLLAFSRRQIVQPKVLDLNRLVNRMTKMLHRVIGEDILLTLALAPELGRVKADPGQVEQVIMNLAINARDAMPDGGRLEIATGNLEVTAVAEDGPRAGVPEGSYVVLSIADTGTGMTDDVRSHIFEPFFTTKPKGKGTGLGLSTVYGIVKQSGGELGLETHPGEGTTFHIYLPRLTGPRKVLKVTGRAHPPMRGSEKVLLVEDEPEVRKLTRSMLRHLGYTVVEAHDGHAALKAWQKHGPSIDLLLTDVIMPNMSGRQLAERLASEQPDLKVLYMSGYTDEVIAHHGVIDPDKELLQKPFSRDLLAEKIRKVLGTAGLKI